LRLSKRCLGSLRKLIDLLGDEGIQEVEVEKRLFGGGRIRVVKGTGQSAPLPAPETAICEPTGDAGPDLEDPAGGTDDEGDALHQVLSPMVGTFYASADPGSRPLVSEGDVVSPGQTLCIIEAMKIMNEIESDIKGRVVRVLAEDGSPVEYNTPLFILEPV